MILVNRVKNCQWNLLLAVVRKEGFRTTVLISQQPTRSTSCSFQLLHLEVLNQAQETRVVNHVIANNQLQISK